MENKKKKSNLLTNIILVIALGVFAFSGYKIYQIYAEYKAIDEEYEAIKEEFVTEENVIDDAVEEEEEVKEVFKVDFDSLLAINDDVIGWIRFDEPAIISYPIAQGRDNNQYLRRSLEGEYLTAGTIFVDYQNDDDFRDENTVIYGHNMKNGSMFGQLKNYRDEEYCKSYPYFYIYTVDGREITYQIFAVKVVLDTSDAYDKIYVDDEEFQEYIDKIYRDALYTSDEVSVSAENKIVTLSTCIRGSERDRLVVYGVAVNEVETGE